MIKLIVSDIDGTLVPEGTHDIDPGAEGKRDPVCGGQRPPLDQHR